MGLETFKPHQPTSTASIRCLPVFELDNKTVLHKQGRKKLEAKASQNMIHWAKIKGNKKYILFPIHQQEHHKEFLAVKVTQNPV